MSGPTMNYETKKSMKIYMTHCSARKNRRLEGSSAKVTPDMLYTSPRVQRFMNRCKTKGVNWAIFSDRYGVWLSSEKHEFYDKPPSKVTPNEFRVLMNNFESELSSFEEIWFYYNPRRFHRLYRELLKSTRLRDRIKLFSHLDEIK
ncbi:MAG: hypothetical protein ABSB56_04575 [Nitrososphaerales archaeon]